MNEEQNASRQIEGLRLMPYGELKALWRTLYANEPPTYNRAYIANRLAYRIQELTFGGLSEAARDRMRRVLIEHGYDRTGMKAKTRSSKRREMDMPVIGTRLVREFRGVRHEVTVVSGGFEYLGRRYRSLTSVAKAITGSHWNGRAFFGLGTRGRKA
ncbi:MAG: DUF2924 domain-containing protein [Armatimonadota bacterium]